MTTWQGLFIVGLIAGVILGVWFGADKPAVSNLIGAFIGAFGAYLVAKLSLENDYQLRELSAERQTKDSLRTLLLSLRTEIVGLKRVYIDVFDTTLSALDAGEAGEVQYQISQEYFTIFNANANRIGDIQNDSLREEIILLYLDFKQMIEMSNLNNIACAERRSLIKEISQSTNVPARNDLIRFKENRGHEIESLSARMIAFNDEIMVRLNRFPQNIDDYLASM